MSNTEFLYDGVNPVQETSGATVLANILGGLGIDEIFVRTGSTGARNFLTDALGSTVALADGAGTIQTEYTYEPFGGTTVTGLAGTNSFQYTGRENDGTGLYHYRTRYYHPTFQRFISEDPIATPALFSCSGRLAVSTEGESLDLRNLYAYVRNRPTVLTDPSGLGPCEDEAVSCFRAAGKRLFQCRKNVVQLAIACHAGCVPLCLGAGPFATAVFKECFVGCEVACAAGFGAGLTACSAIAGAERFVCAQEYLRCKKKRGEPLF